MRTAKGKAEDLILRLLLINVGFFISGMGTALMYKANLGSSPNATLADGFHKVFHITYGGGNLLSNLITLTIVLIFAKDLIRYGTVVCVLIIGVYINFWGSVLPELPETFGMAGRIGAAFFGDVLMAAGLSFYVKVNAGMGPLEAIAELLKRKLKCSYGLGKTLGDAVLLIAGILFGGAFGVGTVISVLCTGFLMQQFFKLYDRHFLFLKRFA